MFSAYGFTKKEIPDLKGKVFIVTGANSGLGFGSTLLLAAHGATVVMACRSRERAEEAKQKLLKEEKSIKPEQLLVMDLDNSSLKSVKGFGRAFRALNLNLDGLILNAGGCRSEFKLTEDGLEETFAVNHLAHFALTNDLLDLLQKAPVASVVAVSSVAHYDAYSWGCGLDEATINDKKKFKFWAAYGQSKLANLLRTFFFVCFGALPRQLFLLKEQRN